MDKETTEQASRDPRPAGALGMKTILAYGIGDIYGGGAFMIVGMLFLFYLTEVVGLSPILAGLVFGIGKVWDAVSDPLMGYISDNTRSRLGRRRVYFLVGIVPITISFVVLWIPVGFHSQALLFLYYSAAYVLFATVFTMVMIPYSALAAELSPDYRVRNRLSGSRIFFSGFSSLLAATIPRIIIDATPARPAAGYVTMSVLFGIFFALPWLIVFFGTKEDTVLKTQTVSRNFMREFLSIFRNKSFRIHIVMYICVYSAMDFLMALFSYYLTYYLRRPGLYSVAMGTLMVVQLAMIVVYVYIANSKGKRFAYIMGAVLWLVGMLATMTLGPSSPVVALVLVCALMGLGTSAGVFIPYAILPNVIDVDELMTGRQRSGVYSGSMTLTRKLIQGALVMPTIGFFLQVIGFVPNAIQTPQVLSRFFVFFLGGPILLIVAGIIAATRFELSPRNSEMIAAELTRLRAGGSADDADPAVRLVCERVSGAPYGEAFKSGAR
ncbi:MAG TPA: MFS transporter [bacterium]|nr:MFS transporter [bacterium]